MSWVVGELTGRIGNQAFIIAATIATALKYGMDYLIPQTVLTNDEAYFKHFPLFDPTIHEVKHWHQDSERSFRAIPKIENMMLRGYYQSWKHTEMLRPLIFEAFNFPKTKIDKVGIHVRRGDFLALPMKHPFSPKYYRKGIEYFIALGFNDFKVFSDDIEWCKMNIGGNGNFEFVEGQTALQDIQELSTCEHMIISASTFSIWAAAINWHPKKIIVRPNHFMTGEAGKAYRDVYYPQWQTITA